MYKSSTVRVSSVRSTSLLRSGLALAVVASLFATSARAAFNADLQALSFGSTNWMSGHISGWAELDPIPTRVTLAGGPASNKTITVNFPHAGVQNLFSFTPSANVVITSGPTLSAPNSGNWSYSFTVNLTDNNPGVVEFRMLLGAGAHNFGGSSLQVDGSPGLSKLFLFKPAPEPGAPDLGILKTGAASANPGSIIAYSITFSNKVNASTATGVQIVDTLPAQVSFVDCTGGCQSLGNEVIWDLGDVTRGSHGVVTYRVAVTNAVTTGFSFQNDAVIDEAENDANLADNTSSVTTMVTSNCIPPSIVAQPLDTAECAGASASFTVAANGSATLQYQWRKDGAAISGANSDTLTLNPLSAADSGSYDVVISNLCGTATSSSATLIVGGPVITSDPVSDSECVGNSASFMVEASGDPLTYQWRKDGGDISAATNNLFEIASVSAPDAGGYDVVVSGTCGSTTSAVATLSVNLPTMISQDPAGVTVCVGAPVVLSVTASGSALTYQWHKDGNDIPGATDSTYSIASSSGADAGSYDVTVTGACGSPANSAAASVTVKSAPVAADDNYSTAEDVPLNVSAVGVLGNDTDGDGDPLTAVLVDGPAHGTLTLNADGSFAYTPNALFSGADSFTYRAQATCGSSDPATVSITVTHVNHAPVASDDSYNMAQDTQLTVSASGVLANDTDVDGDALTAILIDGPSHGVVTLNPDGSFTYTPLAGFSGADAFTYEASDGSLQSATATVTINVAHVNHSPVAVDDSLTIAENSGSHAIDVLANDSDPDGDALTITLTSQPANGSVAITGGGTGLTYTPNSDFSGSDPFTYTISDGNGGTATATVTVTVMHVAVAPVAQDDSYQVQENDTLEVAAPGLLANDTNTEATALTAILVSSPTNGTVTLNADGSFTYVPADNYSGPDSFTYKANNGALDSNVATVHINVLAVHGAGDVDLFVKSAAAKIDRAAGSRDSIMLRGQVNPRGMNTNLTGATIAVEINGVSLVPPQTLDAHGRAKGTVGAIKTSYRLRNANGAYIIKVSGRDLSQVLGLPNHTEAGVTVVTVRLTVNGAALEIPVTTAKIECPFRTTKDRASSVRFNFRKNRTLTGAFNSNRTTAAQSGRVAVRMRGVIETDGSGPIIPTGDVTIQIDNAQISLPVTELVAAGTDYKLLPLTTPSAGTTTLTKFSFRNTTRTFVLSIASGDIPLPAPGPNGPVKYHLPVLITVQTANGPMFFESIIELKRTRGMSTRWQR